MVMASGPVLARADQLAMCRIAGDPAPAAERLIGKGRKRGSEICVRTVRSVRISRKAVSCGRLLRLLHLHTVGFASALVICVRAPRLRPHIVRICVRTQTLVFLRFFGFRRLCGRCGRKISYSFLSDGDEPLPIMPLASEGD